MKTEPKITRQFKCRITTSGYTDRWISTGMEIRIEGGGYCVYFKDEEGAVQYLVSVHGYTPQDANHQIRESKYVKHLPFRMRDVCAVTFGSTTNEATHTVGQILHIFNASTRDDLRHELAETVHLTPEIYFALCYGLYECNESNRLIASTRRGHQIYVSHPAFALYTPFDENVVRNALKEIAIDPSRCYAEEIRP